MENINLNLSPSSLALGAVAVAAAAAAAGWALWEFGRAKGRTENQPVSVVVNAIHIDASSTHNTPMESASPVDAASPVDGEESSFPQKPGWLTKGGEWVRKGVPFLAAGKSLWE